MVGITDDTGQWQSGTSGNEITFAEIEGMSEGALLDASGVLGGYIYKSGTFYQLMVPTSYVRACITDSGYSVNNVYKSGTWRLKAGSILTNTARAGYPSVYVYVFNGSTEENFCFGTARAVQVGAGNLLLDANVSTNDVTANDVAARNIVGEKVMCDSAIMSGNVDAAGGFKVGGTAIHHEWCYVGTMTSTTLGAQNAETKLKVTAINQCKPEGAFTLANNQLTAHVTGWFDVSVEVSSSSNMDGKLVGVGVKRVRSGSSTDVAGPEYSRMAGSYDRVVLSPTPVYLQANDVIYLYGRNNSGAGGTVDTVRWMIRGLFA